MRALIEIKNPKKCCGCHACTNACPKKCIQMLIDDEGFWYPYANKEECIDCGLCEKVCPIICKWQSDESRKTIAMAAINLNDEIRLGSSSGGIFSLIAEEIIKQGGVVFGAAFTDDYKSVQHIYVDNAGDLDKLRGSKYVQSKIGDTYKQAKDFLDNGRMVLFTGTPCQIGCLYSYLGKPYENLFTQDIICHGVPSPLVWKKYVEERELKAAAKTQQMFFRHKKYGWKTFAVLFKFSNNTAYVKSFREDSFMRAFLSNACLRPSCYECSFKTLQRQADITLADFWGIQNVFPEMDDDKGTSLVLIHSNKGSILLKSIEKLIKSKKVGIDIIEKLNPAVVVASAYGKYRNTYISETKFNDVDELTDKYFPISFKNRIINIISKTFIYNVIDMIRRILKKLKNKIYTRDIFRRD